MKRITKETQDKLRSIVLGTEYLLNISNLSYSSGDDGFDKVLDAYCFFWGNALEYKTYYIHREFVENNTILENAIELCDLIKGKYDT